MSNAARAAREDARSIRELIDRPMPACLDPVQLAAYHAACRRIARGVDVGPGTARYLVEALQRAATRLVAAEALAERARWGAGLVEVDELHAALSA